MPDSGRLPVPKAAADATDEAAPRFLSPAEIAAWQPARTAPSPDRRNAPLMAKLKAAGQWNENQIAARRWPMGCVSLEITQRCNLDCTLCYLSENSEAVRDVPLAELFRRIDEIHRHYGRHTDVQVSGGDPTLRRRDELVQIVRRIAELGMRPSLFTNGIKATRDLLTELAANGLVDVAFHVDMTQQRRGYASEAELNDVREDYIGRARGLGLSVFFNTTVFAANYHEIADIVRFFRRHADVVRLLSFQLQADSGRGVLRHRDAIVTPQSVSEQICLGAGTAIDFDVPLIGHPRCNRYGFCLEANGNLYDLFDDADFIRGAFVRTRGYAFDRRRRGRVVATLALALLANPGYWARTVRFVLRKAWAMRRDLVRCRGRVNKLSFFVHNFMDAGALERDRCESCIFMVATADGPLSMCVHNAKRDAYILKPLRVAGKDGPALYEPLPPNAKRPTHSASGAAPDLASTYLASPKRLKGRARQQYLERRQRAAATIDPPPRQR